MPEVTTDRLDWFQAARFGMFIHWGPYAVQQNGEWSQNADEISTADYEVVADGLTAELFDAEVGRHCAPRYRSGHYRTIADADPYP